MSRRTLAYVGLALAVLLAGRLLSSRSSEGPEALAPAVPPALPSAAPSKARPDRPVLRSPPAPVAEYGILTDRDASQLGDLLDRTSLGDALPARLCGDTAACDAVRRVLRDEHATSLSVVSSSDWSLPGLDLDAAARDLSPAVRASVKSRARVVVVHVSTSPSPDQLALRTALAAATLLAEKTQGLVWDQLLERVETPAAFAHLAVTSPLGSPVFRRDRIALLYERRQEGVVRVLTGGLSRWGVADVEASAVPEVAVDRVSELVLGVAQAIADGASASPVTLSRDDLGRARGLAYPLDAGFPALAPLEIDLLSVHPEPGDPNDFLARIEPPAGEGPIAYVDLAERLFGPLLAGASGEGARHDRARAALAPALAAWGAGHASGTRLVVEVPFAIPGDAGVEEVWLELTAFDARTVTGRVMDDPLAATDVHKGDLVTRPRADVDDVDLKR